MELRSGRAAGVVVMVVPLLAFLWVQGVEAPRPAAEEAAVAGGRRSSVSVGTRKMGDWVKSWVLQQLLLSSLLRALERWDLSLPERRFAGSRRMLWRHLWGLLCRPE